jgi:hypothetical protein
MNLPSEKRIITKSQQATEPQSPVTAHYFMDLAINSPSELYKVFPVVNNCIITVHPEL